VKYNDEIEAVELIKVLLLLLPLDFIHGHGLYIKLFEELFDLTSCIMDELPRKDNRVLLGWSRENSSKFVTSQYHESRISTILPFQIHSCYLSNLVTTNTDRANVFEANFQPWYWIKGENDYEVTAPWNNEEQVKKINDTCISLSMFGAEVLKPSSNIWQKIYKRGWAPCPTTANEDQVENDCFEFDLNMIETSKRKAEESLQSEKIASIKQQ
jgi:hypothetical protein